MQSTRRMRAWTSPDFRRRLSVAERLCTTTARLSQRPAPDASFPAVNFNGQRFVPSATERDFNASLARCYLRGEFGMRSGNEPGLTPPVSIGVFPSHPPLQEQG